MKSFKKLLPLIICFMLLFSLSAQAQEGMTVEIATDDLNVMISGNTSVQSTGICLVVKDGVNGARVYIDQKPADGNGNFQFDFALEQGDYTAYLSDGISQSIQEFTATGRDSGTDGNSSSQDNQVQVEAYKVYIAVIGQNDNYLFEPAKVTISEDDKFGLSALSALDATGLDWQCSSQWDEFVIRIENDENQGLKGWKYKINDIVPGTSAADYRVKSNDKIVWWYSKEPGSSGPDINSIDWSGNGTGSNENPKEESGYFTNEDIENVLNQIAQEISQKTDNQIVKMTAILDPKAEMSAEQRNLLEEELENNEVSIQQKVKVNQDNTITDNKEVSLWIPEGAVRHELEITVEEIQENTPVFTENNKAAGNIKRQQQIISSIYDFGPDRTRFDKPITIVLKTVIPDGMNPEDVQLAWYDEEIQQWVPIPAVLDLANGQIIGKIDHFTKFAVLYSPVIIEFNDVNESWYGWAKEAVEALAAQGIVNGIGENVFAPAQPVKRAELCKMIVNLMNVEVDEPSQSSFQDVSASAWYAPYAEAANRKGWMKGDGHGTFRPNDFITREEMAVLISRLLDTEGTVDSPINFADVHTISSWAREGVAHCVKEGMMQGMPENQFAPKAHANRAQAAVLIHRLMQYLKDAV